jgi:hypothetical protein
MEEKYATQENHPAMNARLKICVNFKDKSNKKC